MDQQVCCSLRYRQDACQWLMLNIWSGTSNAVYICISHSSRCQIEIPIVVHYCGTQASNHASFTTTYGYRWLRWDLLPPWPWQWWNISLQDILCLRYLWVAWCVFHPHRLSWVLLQIWSSISLLTDVIIAGTLTWFVSLRSYRQRGSYISP